MNFKTPRPTKKILKIIDNYMTRGGSIHRLVIRGDDTIVWQVKDTDDRRFRDVSKGDVSKGHAWAVRDYIFRMRELIDRQHFEWENTEIY